jgi:excisionase family DNA binding protein
MKKFYSTIDISAICGVDPVTVARWCDHGDLPCYRTPGGHRRIGREDLLNFLHKHGISVPADLEEKRLRVLVVAADTRLLSSLRRRFRDHGGRIDLHTATSGIEGLLKIGVKKPEVVLLDLEIPGFDGLEICRQIRSLDLGDSMKIIALSGASGGAGCRKALKAGAAACFCKPIDLDALQSHILPQGILPAS